MTPGDIPQKIRRFLNEHIHSLGNLDLLLFFWRHADRAWSPQDLNAELRSNLGTVRQQVKQFAAKGFLISAPHEGGSHYQFKNDPGLHKIMVDIAELHSRHLTKLIDCIYAPPTDAVTTFADAFKLKKEDDHDDG